MDILVWIFTIPEKVSLFLFNLTIWTVIIYYIVDEVRKRL